MAKEKIQSESSDKSLSSDTASASDDQAAEQTSEFSWYRGQVDEDAVQAIIRLEQKVKSDR
jgi:hypothetical protein